MRFERLLVGLGCLALVAAAPAQDSLLGKKKGNGGGNGGGQSSSPPKKSSGGSGGGKSSGSESPRKSNGGGGGQSQGGQSQGSQSQGGSPREYSAPQQPGSQREDNYLQRSQSRSGRPQYRSVHNLTSQDTQRQPVIIKRIPPREDANVPMRDQIRREDRAQIRYRDNRNRDDGYRVGYYHYNSRWRDDSFSYPYYAFDPYNTTGACVVSPWYYYPYLPGYISSTRIVYTTNYGNSFIGFPYDYQPSNRYRDDRYSDDRGGRYDDSYVSRRALDNAIDDIVNAFERQDKRSVDRLVPRSGSVSVSVDGGISYGLRVDDFYDMLMDAVLSSRTIDYQIDRVKANDEEAEVVARHDYLDPWGQRQCVYHRFHLIGERGAIVIRYFETSNNLGF